jgi:hypothetical protein
VVDPSTLHAPGSHQPGDPGRLRGWDRLAALGLCRAAEPLEEDLGVRRLARLREVPAARVSFMGESMIERVRSDVNFVGLRMASMRGLPPCASCPPAMTAPPRSRSAPLECTWDAWVRLSRRLEIADPRHHVAAKALERPQHELVVADDVAHHHVVEAHVPVSAQILNDGVRASHE